MEKERTINHLLGADIYRITQAQIEALVDIITTEVRNKTVMGISNVLDRNGNFDLTHGAFKGTFDDGVSRKAYAEARFLAAGLKRHEDEGLNHKTYALI